MRDSAPLPTPGTGAMGRPTSSPGRQTADVGTVDFEDDTVRRFVVRHYAYDPDRRERRHRIIAVFGGKREFERVLDQLSEDLERRRAAGEDVDPREHYSGIVMEPGHLRRAANGHLVRRAVAHGVWPHDLERLELPSNMAVFDAQSSDDPRGDVRERVTRRPWDWLRSRITDE